jgi:hypothetical protein
MTMYQSIQFSLDGDYILDYHDCQSIEEVWDRVNDQGSKWYFHPIPMVIKNNGVDIGKNRIVSAPYGLEFCKGKGVNTISRWIKHNSSYINALLD